MNILIVTAHPSSKGFTHQIAKSLKKNYSKSKKNTVKIVDLYKTEFAKQYVMFEESPAEICTPKFAQKMQEEIKNTDRLILVYPMWNFDMPAIMKNWFDSVFTARFAFRYSSLGQPIGLLSDIYFESYITCDGPKWYYYTINSQPIKSLKNKFKTLCGMKIENITLYDTMRKKSIKDKEKILQSLEN